MQTAYLLVSYRLDLRDTAVDGKPVEWMEKVSDEQYRREK